MPDPDTRLQRKLSDGASAVRRSVRDGVATVEFFRPRHRNALDRQLLDQLLDVLTETAASSDVRVVVLTGAGDHFCSGADLQAVEVGDLAEVMATANRIVLALRDLPHPVIAKVRGVAVGAGCNLALACDLVVADDTATFTQVFPRLGLSVDAGGSWLLPRLVGPHRARELALLGDAVDGRTAAAMGLVNRCVPADELDRAVDELAQRLSAFSPVAQARTKQLLDAAWGDTLADALAHEAEAQVANASTPHFRAALTAFRARHQGAQS